jgi:hypothetical protein
MNRILCSNVQDYVAKVSLVKGCDEVQDGILRLLTPFRYPNGANIDLFLKPIGPMFDEFLLTDLGQTTSYLLDMQVRPWATNKRRQIIEDICKSLDVSWSGAQLEVPLSLPEVRDISGPMMRLAQACIRMSDLGFSARLWTAGLFKEELEEFLESAVGPNYQTDTTEMGRSGEMIKFDFKIRGETSASLILALSAGSSVSAHNVANEVTARWFDLGRRKNFQQITVLDESHDVFKDADLKRVGLASTIIPFPTEQEQLRATVLR